VIIKVTIICLLVLTGCVSRLLELPSLGGTQPLVKIGLAAPFEGLNRPLGYEALAGVKLALAERNATGGVGGYNVELVALNDFNEPDEARLQAEEFAADPAVLGVVTGWTEETARASLPVYRQAGLAVAVPWSVHPELADPESGVVLVAADEQRAAGVLAEAIAAVSPSRLAVVADGPSATLYVESVDALGMEASVILPPNALDGEVTQEWVARLVSDREQTPDALIVTTDGALAGEVLLILTVNGWNGATFAGTETGSVHLVGVAGNVADGLVYVSPAPAGHDLSQAENNSAQGIKGLGPRGVLAYDTTSVLLDAIELAIQKDGYPSRRGIIAVLPKVRRYGLTGEITFDAAGRRIDAPAWLYNIVDNYYPGRLLSTQLTTSEE
jgi:ABC-type branched-subunit amino acid transport system substrate-binding protein